jgi:hypothetical protein
MTDDLPSLKNARRFKVTQPAHAWEELQYGASAFLADFAFLESRLNLLRRLGAIERMPDLPKELQQEIDHICKVGDALRECRDGIAQAFAEPFEPNSVDPNQATVPLGTPRPLDCDPRELSCFPDGLAGPSRDRLHDLATVRNWTGIAVQLSHATHLLAQKLVRFKHSTPWQHLICPTIDMPVRDTIKKR